ncbi:MAG: LysM peptidoglycan-binding domain-containing protein [Streptosporangiales bacterium]|nr:LysM peptidoglycan-binding domain-containing protein [Streptosporangiales bacterium]
MSASAGVAFDLEPPRSGTPVPRAARPSARRPRLSVVPDEPAAEPAPPTTSGAVVPRPSRPASPLGRAAVSSGAANVGWRLTRRGRAVLLGLLVVLVTAAAIGWGAATASGAATDSPETITVIVGDGDTLWSIAADVAADRDPRATIEQIKETNDLHGSKVEPGQQLVVPVGTR